MKNGAMLEIVPGVHQLKGYFSSSNVFIVLGERVTLIDVGWPGWAGYVANQVRRLGRAPEEIDLVVLTHYHLDHSGAVAELKRAASFKTVAHELDAPFLMGQRVEEHIHAGYLTGPLRTLMRPFLQLPPIVIDMPLQDLQELPDGGGIQVIHTPGHTGGSICLYFPTYRLLLVGDAVNRSRHGVDHAYPHYTANRVEAARSLLRLTELDIEVMGFGHGPPLRDGGKALRELALRPLR